MQGNPKVKWAVALVGLAVLGLAASFLITILKAGIAAIAIAVVALAGVNLLPLVGDWFATLRLKGTRALAKANPIETKLIEWQKMTEALDLQKDAIEKYDASVQAFMQLAKGVVKKWPDRRAEFEPQVAGRIALSKARWAAWEQARADLSAMKDRLDEEKEVWKATQALLAADAQGKKLKGNAATEIKLDAATEAIRDSAALSVAKLESSLREMDFNKEKQLAITDDAAEAAAKLFA